MSYDIEFLLGSKEPCPACGHAALTSGKTVFETNHTSNTSKMWREAGCDLVEFHAKYAKELGPKLADAIAGIENNVEHYKKYEPENKWGTVESTLVFLREIHDACYLYPDAVVYVSN